MTKRFRTLFVALLVSLGLPVLLRAQDEVGKHRRYTLVDLGTFGGPNSNVDNTPTPMNVEATVAGSADTPLPDPFDPNCFLDCFVAHTFQWRKGVLTDLGALSDGVSSTPNGINAAGVIAGISENGLVDPNAQFPPEFDAVVWKDGQIIDLGTFGGTFSYANAINSRSQVVGFALNGIPDSFFLSECGTGPMPTQMRAFIWHEGGGLLDLGTLGGPDSCATLINKRGQVAGHSFTNFTPNPVTGVPTDHPFIWKSGEMTDLGSLGGTLGHPNGINNRGQVCGDSNLSGDLATHAFLWDQGTMHDLGTLGGSASLAEALNDSGEVVGGALTADDQSFHAFLWKHGVMTDLETVAGDGCSVGTSINSKGMVVGQSFACDGSAQHAFLWERGGPAIDLNAFVPPGSRLSLTNATFIAERGEIVGQAVLPNGDQHAFQLVPERDDEDEGEGAADGESE